MSSEIYMAAAAALAYEKRLDAVANNLANINTAGFKRDDISFQAYMLSSTGTPEAVVPPYASGGQASDFWIECRSRTDFSPGPMKRTDAPFDLALGDKGFFTVQSPVGMVYTRRGNFTLNGDGILVTQEGWPVMGEGGEIRIEGRGAATGALEVTVGEDGSLQANGANLDRLLITDFSDPGRLVKTGDSYFKPESEAAGALTIERPVVAQGFLEMANVEAVQMMTEMIEILRGYEAYQRVIRAADDTDAKSIGEVGRSA
jgi:flagellar basal-body rod protein FlgG